MQLFEPAYQQKYYLLIRPLQMLDYIKATDDKMSKLLSGIDMLYLGFEMLTYIMEGIESEHDQGRTKEEVRQHLEQNITRMNSKLTASECHKVANIVMDGIDNSENNYQEFSFEYFDMSKQKNQTFRFRLTKLEQDSQGNYHYKLTSEGYLILREHFTAISES